ncbi:hypothetical protein KPA93_08110 [Burkholderia cenocepacia]|uniref:hypothetical protein n=1 Tax=Burkholderia cenocepacia TaxID=95486 RepID=UPI001F27B40D|nr:hypothetical protein [Burkholderia cenocepacia]MCF1369456.1 hypothetical protein [Burkholderia cenocepacia]MCF1386513.1 hypothetical protein [Burkholderia cenocepacia]MDR8031415.1 hypothetical protein [Burkholderia cenocepacia]MDR8040444.1 hypothetical protein [Burkholderia cenocepacia]
MPVELPELDPPDVPPRPPRASVWIGLLVVVMIVGAALALWTWPKGEPSDSAWFWVRVFGLPALTWCAMFGLRLHYYDEQMQRRQAERDVRAVEREKKLRFAREPLAVLACTYLIAPGSTAVASKIAGGKLALSARTSAAGIAAIRHTALELNESKEMPGRYRACFNALLEQIAGAVMAVPTRVPFSVQLLLPADADHDDLLDTWHSCWVANNLRPAPAKRLSIEQGVMIVDEWLDIRGGPSLECATLFVSVQLHDNPPQSSAEAAVGMLLAWAPLAERYGLTARALLHRPVEMGASGLDAALSEVLLWGETTAAEINDLWQAGVPGRDQRALLQAASDAKLGVSQTAGLSGVHDVDLAIGHSGVSAGWLDLALGIEHAIQTGAPQLMAWHEGALRFAVARIPRA